MTAAMLEDPPALAEAAVPLAPPRPAALPGQVPLPQMAAVLVTDGLPVPGDPARGRGWCCCSGRRGGCRGTRQPLPEPPTGVRAAA